MTDQTSAGTIERETLTVQALRMRKGGATFRQIARTLNISISTAHEYVSSAIAELRDEKSDLAIAVRDLQLVRLDSMLRQLWRKRDQPRVADTILRMMQREADLVGADAPKRTELSGPNGRPMQVMPGEIDLDKLSFDQLKQLEEIVLAGGATPLPATTTPASS